MNVKLLNPINICNIVATGDRHRWIKMPNGGREREQETESEMVNSFETYDRSKWICARLVCMQINGDAV